MADRYSDDEELDDLEYTTTTTLLGYAETTPSDDPTSHIGGVPTWLDEPMDARLAKCLSCNNLMLLLLQLDGNLPDSPQHTRMLYLFGCRAKSCRKKPGSIRAIRGIKSTGASKPDVTKTTAANEEPKQEAQEEQTPKTNMGDMIFGSSSSGAPTNPFATSSSQTNPFAKANPFSSTTKTDDNVAKLTKTFAAVASISSPEARTETKPSPPQPTLIGPPSPWPPASEIPQYPNYYLDASYEELEPDALTLQSQKLAKTIQMDTSDDMDEDITPSSSKKALASSSKPSKESKEKEFESSMNVTFLHFQNITSQNPEQVLRYERKGVPLLYSRDDSIGRLLASSKRESSGPEISFANVPKCTNCGRGRCYEIQLMPHAISVLEEGVEAALDEGMVWGTIIVGTCEVDCSIDGSEKGKYIEEWVGVQWETD